MRKQRPLSGGGWRRENSTGPRLRPHRAWGGQGGQGEQLSLWSQDQVEGGGGEEVSGWPQRFGTRLGLDSRLRTASVNTVKPKGHFGDNHFLT